MKINSKRRVLGLILGIVIILTVLFNFYTASRGNSLFNTKMFAVTKDMEIADYKAGDLVFFSRNNKLNIDGDRNYSVGDVVGIVDSNRNKITKIGQVTALENFEVKLNTSKGEVIIDREHIMGRITDVISKVGYIFIFLKHPIVVGLIVLLLVFEIIRTMMKNLKNHHEMELREKENTKTIKKSDARIEGLDLKALYKHNPNYHNKKKNIRFIKMPKYKVTVKDVKNYKIGEDFISK